MSARRCLNSGILAIFIFITSVAASRDDDLDISDQWMDRDGNAISLSDGVLKTKVNETFLLQKKLSIPAGKQYRFIILPPIWQNLTVTVNKHVIVSDADNRIITPFFFRAKRYAIPEGILQGENTISVSSKRIAKFVTFRGNKAYLTTSEYSSYDIADFLINDAHFFFITALLILSIISLLCGAMLREVNYLSLSAICLGILPHNILATSLYERLHLTFTAALKIHLVFLNLVLVFIYIFFFPKLSNPLLTRIVSRKNAGIYGMASFAVVAAMSIVTPNIDDFMMYIYPLQCLSFVWSIFFLITSQKKDFLYFVLLIGSTCAVFTPISDTFQVNLYLMAHGFFIFQLSGIVMLVQDTVRSKTSSEKYMLIIKDMLPPSLHATVASLSETSASVAQVCEKTNTSGLISVVLVDICNWNTMSNTKVNDIPRSIIKQATDFVFSEIEAICARHEIEFVKTMGDGMLFAGGLYRNSTSVDLSTRTLSSISEIIESIDHINVQLCAKSLPAIKLKLSGTMGFADYGITRYQKKMQFDVLGEIVSSAFRLLSHMDETFYKEVGKDVALVEKTLTVECNNLEIRRKFASNRQVPDEKNDNIYYSCFLMQKNGQKMTEQEFLKNLYGNFSHAQSSTSPSNDTTMGAPPTGFQSKIRSSAVYEEEASFEHPTTFEAGVDTLPQVSLEDRKTLGPPSPDDSGYLETQAESALEYQKKHSARVHRLKNYYEGYTATVIAGALAYKAQIGDLSSEGIGLLFSEDHSFLYLRAKLSVAFVVEGDQLIELNVVVRNKRTVSTEKGHFIRIGAKIAPPERTSPERKNRRFDVSKEMLTGHFWVDIYQKRRVHFVALDLSAEGIALNTDSDALFFPGMSKDFFIAFPNTGVKKVKAQIKSATPNGADTTRIGLFISPDLNPEYRYFVGDYLASLGRSDISLKDIKKEGLGIASIDDILKVEYVNRNELDDILSIRLEAWQSLGYFQGVADPLRMKDKFDDRARHIICKIGKKSIGSIRLVFNSKVASDLEVYDYGVEVEEAILNEGALEASRAVILPSYRGSVIFFRLIYEAAKVVLETGNRYVILNCDLRLFPVYKSIGFRKYCDKVIVDEQGTKSIVAILDIKDAVLKSKNLTLMGWSILGKKLLHESLERGLTDDLFITPPSRIIKTLVSPFIERKYSEVKKRRKK